VVENPALAGIEGPPLRGIARDRGGCPARYRVLERAQAPLPVGPQTAPPHRAPPRGRHRAEYGNNLPDAPLRNVHLVFSFAPINKGATDEPRIPFDDCPPGAVGGRGLSESRQDR